MTTTVDQDQVNALQGYALAGIDGKTQGNNTVFTTANNGLSFFPETIDLILTTLTALTTPPVVNVGWTASNFTDLINAQALLNNLSTQGTVFRVPLPAANMTPIPANTAVVLRVSTGATATTYTFKAIIRGYYA